MDITKLTVVGSYYGVISHLTDSTISGISCIKADNSLDEEKWEGFMRHISSLGANATRELPFWSISFSDHGFMPFKFYDGKFDLDYFNDLYFKNLLRMVEIANQHGVKFILSLFDHCHIKPKNKLTQFNPWTNNHQNIKDFYNAGKYITEYVKTVLRVLKNKNCMFEICNEPDSKNFPAFACDVLNTLWEFNIADANIIIGVENDTPLYRNFRKELMKRFDYINDQYWEKLKHIWPSVIHQINNKTFTERLALQSGHTRRYFLSSDGNHPKTNKDEWHKWLVDFFRLLGDTTIRNSYIFEAMHKNSIEDDFNAVEGISQAIKDVYGVYPVNYVPEYNRGGNGLPGDPWQGCPKFKNCVELMRDVLHSNLDGKETILDGRLVIE